MEEMNLILRYPHKLSTQNNKLFPDYQDASASAIKFIILARKS